MKLKRRSLVLVFAVALSIFGNSVVCLAEVSTANAKVIDGDMYVKLDDLPENLGLNKGKYESETGTYVFEAANTITQAVKKTSPSVVAIIGQAQPKAGENPANNNRFNLIHGTGVIYDSNGSIVTNAHVVKDMKQITVVTAEGHHYPGKKVSLDEASDLALVKIEASGLTPATFADKLDNEVGDPVIAIGTPVSFTLRNTVTAGVLSGIGRSINSPYRLLQTDAAINPGNSGGALVNTKGEVVGINTLKFVAEGVDNIGFAIPSDTVIYVMKQFMQNGKVIRASLGMTLEESWAAVVGLPSEDPLTIVSVHSGTTENISAGDLLYSIDGVPVKTIVDVNELLKKYEPGQSVILRLQSNGDIVEHTLTLIEGK